MLAELGSFGSSWLRRLGGHDRLAEAERLGDEAVEVEARRERDLEAGRCRSAVDASTAAGVDRCAADRHRERRVEGVALPADLVQRELVQPLLRRRGDEVGGAAGGGVEPPDAGPDVGVGAAADGVDDVRRTEDGRPGTAGSRSPTGPSRACRCRCTAPCPSHSVCVRNSEPAAGSAGDVDVEEPPVAGLGPPASSRWRRRPIRCCRVVRLGRGDGGAAERRWRR